jgi:hypothetical protein
MMHGPGLAKVTNLAQLLRNDTYEHQHIRVFTLVLCNKIRRLLIPEQPYQQLMKNGGLPAEPNRT